MVRNFPVVFFGLSAIALAFSIPAWATKTYTVTDTIDADCTLATGGSAGDLQACLIAAQNDTDDSILNIAAGVYQDYPYTYAAVGGENYDLTLIGENEATTILDGEEFDRVLSVDTTGAGGDGGVLITIQNLTIRRGDITGAGNGGGMDIQTNDGSAAIDGCTIEHNKADNAGGVEFSSSTGDISISNSSFLGNVAGFGTSGDEGAFFATGSGSITLSGNTFEGNAAVDDDGAARLNSSQDVVLTDNQFIGNTAVDDHGALNIDVAGTGTLTMTHNLFLDNSAGDGQGVMNVQTNSGDLILTRNTFDNNFAGNSHGAADLYSNSGGIILTDNLFTNNHVDNGSSGVAFIDVVTGDISVTNNTFSGNHAAADGGALSLYMNDDASTASLFNNIFFNNSAGGDGADVYVNDDGDSNNMGSTATISTNDIAGFFSKCQNTGGCTNHFSNPSNITVDPLFVDAANGDFHLSSASPVIDLGTASAPSLPATDIDGDARTIGAAPDLGADEATGSGISVTPAVIDFGNVTVGTSSTPAVVTISNQGADALAVNAITVSDTTVFSLNLSGGSTPCGSLTPTLARGASCTVAVGFEPSAEGLWSATLTIASNDPDRPSVGVSLEGAGTVGTADADGDGVANATDNCPNVANADQADQDRDGVGDACDLSTANTGGCSLIR
jgi:uncharacterized protein DUF5123/centrosomal CEP192-like protein/thrombospondin type 3 repeat protein